MSGTNRKNATHVRVDRVEVLGGKILKSRPCIRIEDWERIKTMVLPKGTEYDPSTIEYIDATKLVESTNYEKLKQEIEELEEKGDLEKLIIKLYDMKGAPNAPWVTGKIARYEKLLAKKGSEKNIEKVVRELVAEAEVLEANMAYDQAHAKYGEALEIDPNNKFLKSRINLLKPHLQTKK